MRLQDELKFYVQICESSMRILPNSYSWSYEKMNFYIFLNFFCHFDHFLFLLVQLFHQDSIHSTTNFDQKNLITLYSPNIDTEKYSIQQLYSTVQYFNIIISIIISIIFVFIFITRIINRQIFIYGMS
jgi:hypothetical protein